MLLHDFYQQKIVNRIFSIYCFDIFRKTLLKRMIEYIQIQRYDNLEFMYKDCST